MNFKRQLFTLFAQVALLCGPPGLGKTTLGHVIAKHAGYNVVEMNARCVLAILASYLLELDNILSNNFVSDVRQLVASDVTLTSLTVRTFCSDDRTTDVFKQKIESAIQMRSVLEADPRPNCLIIDEIDGAPAVRHNLSSFGDYDVFLNVMTFNDEFEISCQVGRVV